MGKLNLDKIDAVIQWGSSKKIVVTLLKLTLLYRPIIALLRWIYIHDKSWHKLWERKALQFYSQFVSKDSLCFDIGAHVGSRTDLFRKLGAYVVAVEPQNNCVSILRNKYGTDSNVIIVQKALGANRGEIDIQICTFASEVSSCSREWIDARKARGSFGPKCVWDKTESVQMTTLDDLIAEFGLPSFCKIDVEGFEYEVIKGLSQAIKAISLEATPAYMAPAISSILKLVDLGLTRFNYSVGESMQWALRRWVSPAEMCSILENLPDRINYVDVYATI